MECEIKDEAGNDIIIHPAIPNNEHYFGAGRPCPLCKQVWLSCSVDLESHKSVCQGPNKLGWKRSKYKTDEEYVPAEKDKELVIYIKQNGGILQLGTWQYTLSVDEKYLKRKLAKT